MTKIRYPILSNGFLGKTKTDYVEVSFHHFSVFTSCRQFHQRFTRAFFVRNFGAKNYKLKHLTLRLFDEKILRKTRSKNVDEIDTLGLISPSVYEQL